MSARRRQDNANHQTNETPTDPRKEGNEAMKAFQKQILVSFAVILTLFSGNIAFLMWELDQTHAVLNEIHDVNMKAINGASRANIALLEMERLLLEIVIEHDQDNIEKKVIQLAQEKDELNKDLDIVKGFSDRQTIKKIDQFYQHFKEWEAFKSQAISLARSEELTEAQAIIENKALDPFHKADKLLLKIVNYTDEQAEITYEKSEKTYYQALTATFLFLALNYIIVAFIVFRIGSRTKSLTNGMTDVVESLDKEATQINLVNSELLKASESVNSACEEQAAAIQESVASMSEINAIVNQTTAQSKQSETLARNVDERTKSGERIMLDMVQSMDGIKSASKNLQGIASIINEVKEKTNVINEIVAETRLLSFNASIEAARAGQHGRGFAVVAQEVGNLAQTSGQAAKEIENLLKDSQNQVDAIIQETGTSVDDGLQVSEQAQVIFRDISTNINEIKDQTQSVSDATTEQQKGIQQISQAISQLNTAVQNNTRVSKQATKLANGLSQKAGELKGLSGNLRTIVRSEKGNDLKQFKSNTVSTTNTSNTAPLVAASVDELSQDLQQKLDSDIKSVTADDPDFEKIEQEAS